MADEEWHLEHLQPGGADVHSVPGRADTIRLVKEYRDSWTTEEPLTLDRLITWVCDKFHIDVHRFTWNDMHTAIKGEAYKMQRLQVAIGENGIEDEDTFANLHAVADVVYSK